MEYELWQDRMIPEKNGRMANLAFGAILLLICNLLTSKK